MNEGMPEDQVTLQVKPKLEFCKARGREQHMFLWLGFEGVQNKHPQDVLLWHVDYFEVKATEIMWGQEKRLPLP